MHNYITIKLDFLFLCFILFDNDAKNMLCIYKLNIV